MKRTVLALLAIGFALSSFAQTDTTAPQKADTIRVGGMIIIKKPGRNNTESREVIISNKKRSRSNLTTNWWIVDMGFANYSDNTNYATARQSGFVSPDINSEDNLGLRNGKSVNVNIWAFHQRLNLIRHAVNLKYGFGIELNNYRYSDERVRFSKNPTRISLDPALANAKKNKLAADYVTIPMMLNFNFTPSRRDGFGFSAGMSVGYLYSARQKIKDGGDKTKTHDDFNLEKWKISYIGELMLGPIRLYGSLATRSMWERGLDQTPYNVGVRFSHF